MTQEIGVTSNKPQNTYSLANLLRYAFNQSIMNVNTILIAQIVTVNADGTFDVQPVINGLAADGKSVTLPVIYEVPNSIIQGGNAGIIVHPKAGDTVVIGCCQRDITAFKATLKQSNPSSLRKFSLSDAIILASYPTTAPTVFIDVDGDKVTITAPTVTLNASAVNLGSGASSGVLTAQSQIKDGDGRPCTIVTSSSTVKASN